MRKILLGAILLFLSLNIAAQDTEYVLLISVDGMRPEFYLSDKWDTPVLKKLKSEGVYAQGMKTIFPSVTYPSHTSIITGCYPAEHGIFYNVPFLEKNGHWYYEHDSIKSESLWDATNKAGLITGSVYWPVSVGAPITYNFPVRRPDNIEKKDFNQITLTEKFVTPKNLMSDMVSKGIMTKEPSQFTFPEQDATIGRIGGYILTNYQPHLTAVHFLGTDHFAHEHGANSQEVHNAMAFIDKEIGKLIDILEEKGIRDKTAIIVLGDHGMSDSDITFSPNTILRDLGLIGEESWEAKFKAEGGSAFLYLNDPTKLLSILEKFDQLSPEEKKLFTIIDKEQLIEVGADPDAVLALAMSKGVSANGAIKGALVGKKKKNGSHGYFPTMAEMQTGFIISGAGIKKGSSMKTIEVTEVAPLIAELLKVPFGKKSSVASQIIER